MPGKTVTTRGGAAVMQNRAPRDVEGDDPQAAFWRQIDYFPTPLWGSRAGAEVLRGLDPSCRVVREPACGQGHMAAALGDYFEVLPSDVHAHRPNTPVKDWLDPSAWDHPIDCDWIMTNPPFTLAHEFVRLGLQRARRGVALLLRIAFLECEERYPIMVGPDARLTLLATFCERLPMTLGKWDLKKSSATCYAWFFWAKDIEPLPPAWIAPGTRDRLWLPSDSERWAYREPLPLFGDEA